MKNIINIIKEELQKINEVSDEIYDLIDKKYNNKRIIMTKNNVITFNDITKQKSSSKPSGLWYGIGTSWIDWVKSEMPKWDYENIFEVKINESKVLKIDNIDDLYEFTEKYEDQSLNNTMMSNYYIDWNKLSNEYSGIEIVPHIYEAVYDLNWYYGWDVASGCIWNKNGIININKIN
jgi:hypothetical protein